MIKYVLYQLSEIEKSDYAFMNWKFASKHGFSFADYAQVYRGKTDPGEIARILNMLFEVFNIGYPEDFSGHSLSVSDIIELVDEDDNSTFWYCDIFGWEDISDLIKV